MTVVTETALGLGSNLGDRQASLLGAIGALARTEGIWLSAVSSLWNSAAWGLTDQPDFLNACILVRTELAPMALLDTCRSIESMCGRVRDVRWGPRTLDIDILFYGAEQIETETLTLPHPRMLERNFVLAPLAEIAPDHILSGKRVVEHLRNVPMTGLERVGALNGWR